MFSKFLRSFIHQTSTTKRSLFLSLHFSLSISFSLRIPFTFYRNTANARHIKPRENSNIKPRLLLCNSMFLSVKHHSSYFLHLTLLRSITYRSTAAHVDRRLQIPITDPSLSSSQGLLCLSHSPAPLSLSPSHRAIISSILGRPIILDKKQSII